MCCAKCLFLLLMANHFGIKNPSQKLVVSRRRPGHHLYDFDRFGDAPFFSVLGSGNKSAQNPEKSKTKVRKSPNPLILRRPGGMRGAAGEVRRGWRPIQFRSKFGFEVWGLPRGKPGTLRPYYGRGGGFFVNSELSPLRTFRWLSLPNYSRRPWGLKWTDSSDSFSILLV